MGKDTKHDQLIAAIVKQTEMMAGLATILAVQSGMMEKSLAELKKIAAELRKLNKGQ